MISLLLVLSIFVSSGVLWELHDTVITMVNDPICGMGEHEHTDECYEYRLVCGLEENEEHTHTDECYEKVLVCGHDEHFHTALCYTDEELTENSVQSEDDEDIISIELPADDENENVELPVFKLGNDSVRVMDGEGSAVQDDEYNPVPIETIDNIARGIKFTLFDYYENENALEAEQNNYGISPGSEPGQWVHNNIKYVGVNYDYEHSIARNPEDDILFFAYGTPAFTGEVGTFNASGGDAYKNYTRDWYNGKYNPSKNNYAGDYNADVNGNTLSGNRPIQGIVNNTLENGYPTISGSGHSLAYLFDENDTSISSYKTSYTDVNHFLKSVNQNGVEHLVYNSDENYAYFDQSTNNFIVYNGTYHIINNDHHRAGDYNNLTDEKYGDKNGGEFKIGFFPFDQYDTNRRDPNYNGNGFNHHFGMKMEADFFNIKKSEEPIIFKYSGDDDMWVFVDDVLVLDIGGIHEPAAGMIDFTNGLIWTQDNLYGKSATVAYTELNLPELSDISLPDNGVNTDGASESKWKVETIASKFTNGKTWNDASGAKHSIKMFYLERGGCYSNLAMDMNLPTVRPLSITKSVDYGDHYSNAYDDKKYSFTIYEEIVENGITVYKPADLGEESNTFTLEAGGRKDFYNLAEGRKFYVAETGVDTNFISDVSVNGVSKGAFITPIGNTNIVSGDAVTLSSVNQYDFTNTIRDEKTNISVSKVWKDANGNVMEHPPDYPIKFKIYQTDTDTKNDTSETKPVEIGGMLTFTINSPDWIKTFSALPKRYGYHVYTYSVVEQNVPSGYKASYSKDANGNLTITNTDITKTDIWVEKEWINAPSNNMQPVTLTLKRKKATYAESSTQTSLTINIRDARSDTDYNGQSVDNIIKTITLSNVYVGGSVEFQLDLPKGVRYYDWDSNYKVGGERGYYRTSSGITLTEIADKVFEVSNLQRGSNVVDIKVTTDDIDDGFVIYHHSFTKRPDGWVAQGNTTVETSGTRQYAKGDALLVSGKTKAYEGVKLKLDPLKFKAGNTYTFSVYVYQETGSNVTFAMTFNDGLDKPSQGSYHGFSSVNAPSGEWTLLTGTITLPEEINPYGMYLLIETYGDNIPASFRMDEFTAIEGSKYVSVAENTGVVSIALKPYYYDEFGDNDFNGWSSFGGTTISTDHHQGDYYILIKNRDNVFDGISKPVPLLIPGKSYRFHADVSGDDGKEENTHLIGLSINKINLDSNNASYSNFKNITVLSSPINAYNWGTLDTVYTIPSEADRDNMFVYFESPKDIGDTNDFRVWNFKVVDPDDFSVKKDGYTLSNAGINGVYVSNNDQYKITENPASITNPLVLESDYTDDTDWNNGNHSITLPKNSNVDGNSWMYHWDSQALSESSNHNIRYLYYVEETAVGGGLTVGSDYILLPIENNNVASNDESTPILVKNKNIKFTLPETGGGGTGRIYIFGGVLTVIGIISLSALYRRKRRRV
ncbi:fibro-slime domain-containing protein [Ruminococcus flavefaciens]|uniref:Fibro-slime domain-containing protein n=1 Tax=Ruminococcus flavefaciens TaxID=1265 RepID=A0A1H6J087_RUMFL|nr:carbohydrate binding domain-containing protein [Ruminococcus flavefaciens]SEH52823.1 fibro-slime domain-containing protein [Ruminococcus flavefaciens]